MPFIVITIIMVTAVSNQFVIAMVIASAIVIVAVAIVIAFVVMVISVLS